MKSLELLKFNERQSLVQIFKDNGEHHQYCVCSYYDENKPEGSKWSWGHYFTTMEGALKYIATECFSPIYQYVVIKTDSYREVTEKVFNDYDKAHKAMEEEYKEHRDDEESTYAEYAAGIYEEEATVYFGDDWVQWKLIEIKIG